MQLHQVPGWPRRRGAQALQGKKWGVQEGQRGTGLGPGMTGSGTCTRRSGPGLAGMRFKAWRRSTTGGRGCSGAPARWPTTEARHQHCQGASRRASEAASLPFPPSPVQPGFDPLEFEGDVRLLLAGEDPLAAGVRACGARRGPWGRGRCRRRGCVQQPPRAPTQHVCNEHPPTEPASNPLPPPLRTPCPSCRVHRAPWPQGLQGRQPAGCVEPPWLPWNGEGPPALAEAFPPMA